MSEREFTVRIEYARYPHPWTEERIVWARDELTAVAWAAQQGSGCATIRKASAVPTDSNPSSPETPS